MRDIRVMSVAVHPDDPEIAYITIDSNDDPSDYHTAVWQTADGGRTWAETGNVSFDTFANPTEAWGFYPASAWRVAIDPHNPRRMMFADAWGIYRSTDAGTYWRSSVVGAQNTCVTDVLVDPQRYGPDRLFATHMDAGLLMSSDAGETWQAVLPRAVREREPLAGHFWQIASARDRDGTTTRYYAAAKPWARHEGLLLRSYNGHIWHPVFTNPVPEGGRGLGNMALAIDPRNTAILYVAQDGGRVFRSTDHGDTWAPTSRQPDANRFNALLVDEDGRLFAASHTDGLWRSNNGGRSWRRVLRDRDYVWSLAAAGGAVYATADDGNLYRTRDGGRHWDRLTHFAPDDDPGGEWGNHGAAVAINPNDPDHIVFSRTDMWHFVDAGDGVFESFDGGETWQSANEGLGLPRVWTLDFASDGTLYAGTFCAGLWRRPPGEGS
jgi:photosystem II stability/assembly factor-like uncharacterized protein